MLKEAIKYIVELAAPKTEIIGGEVYSDKKLERISYNPKAETLKVSTLSSLVDYIKNIVDAEYMTDTMILHIVSPTRVRYYSSLDVDHEREYFIEANANIPEFDFGRFYSHEEFNISIQSKFIEGVTDRALLLKFSGTVEAGSVAEYGDDGISQKATVKTGIASKGDALIPNPVFLAPYRTFVEVEQPASQFVFRMKQDARGDIACALFEADGGAWKKKAIENIRSYLTENLKETQGIIILS